jgi:cytosine/creatinine deaminase
MSGRTASTWYRHIQAEIDALGGMRNAHLHLDRVGTFDESYWDAAPEQALTSANMSLHQKHHLIHKVHASPAYVADDFATRVNRALDVMVDVNTAVAETLVDVTADSVGMDALDWMNGIKAQRSDIDLRVGAYSPFGFRDDEPMRWEVFEAGARKADFIGCLPEADDVREYPQHIGFAEHIRRVLELARELDIPVQVHVDQRFEDSETGSEDLIEVVRELGWIDRDAAPRIWAVHAISPSTYDEARFQRMVDGLVETNIGIITCPSAALGMRMYRPLTTPTGNSIPRVLELLAAGVSVRMGSDNIDDICSPSTTADLVDEVFALSAALRYYDVRILAKIAAGQAMEEHDRDTLREHIAGNEAYIARFLARFLERR